MGNRELVDALVAALLAEGREGRVFDDAILADAVPVLLLSVADAADPEALPPALVRMLERFFERAGIDASADPAEVVAGVERYLEAHPLPPALWRAVESAFASVGAGDEARARLFAFARFSGVPLTAPKVGEAPPEGTVRGGLLARAKLAKREDDE